MLKLVLDLSLLGLLTSSIFSIMVVAAACYFAWQRRMSRLAPGAYAPGVSLFKPLHGAEPDLAAHLASFFEQENTGPLEILFCARELDDPGLTVAREVAARYPHIPTRFLAVEGPLFVNAKVSSLQRMEAFAAHDIFIISDSDVRVSPGYVREVVSEFRDGHVGAVTCLYRGLARQGLWAKLEASGMSVEMSAGVLAANLVEGMQFLLGPTMAVRREAVRRMGGFGRLGQYCSDDFLLGSWVAGLGYKIVLSRHVIDHVVLNLSFLTSMKHQIRWMKSTRFSRPKGHLGTGLTFSVPFGLLAASAAELTHRPLLGGELLLYAVLSRMAMALFVSSLVVEERSLGRTVLLYPLRDLMGFVFWLLSYTGGTILWRGQLYELREHGLMQRAGSMAESAPDNGTLEAG